MTERPLRAVVATRSGGKLRELGALLAPLGWSFVTLDELGVPPHPDEDLVEHYDTFEMNALAKARWFAQQTGLVAVADDSGLVVDALGGAPGVRSRRWSGRSDLSGAALDAANNAFLLSALSASGANDRHARFVCAAACAWPSGSLVTEGVCEGTILHAPRGSGGFGYDPYFLVSALGATFAEATMEAKGRVSHRGRAFRALVAALQRLEIEGQPMAAEEMTPPVDHG